MALNQAKIDGLRAMYHNAGSTQGEKDNAKAILERNGESLDVPKKASSGGTGTNPAMQKAALIPEADRLNSVSKGMTKISIVSSVNVSDKANSLVNNGRNRRRSRRSTLSGAKHCLK